MDRVRRRSAAAGQATVEWVGLLLLVALLLAALLAAGVRVPGAALAGAIAARLTCALSLGGDCGEQALVAEYGEELAAQVRRQAPTLVYEPGMHALPVDFRRCRSSACGDGRGEGIVLNSRRGEPVTAFVHVVDCRRGSRTPGADCSGGRDGNLYIQYWTYYADSATLRGVPYAGGKGYHRHDWEGVELRISPGGDVDERASSHNGFNYEQGAANWGSDAGWGFVRAATEKAGARPAGGWGPATGALFVSGGSHAGNAKAWVDSIGSLTPGRRLRLVPLEPIARGSPPGFGTVVPPWLKQVWLDPEADGTS